MHLSAGTRKNLKQCYVTWSKLLLRWSGRQKLPQIILIWLPYCGIPVLATSGSCGSGIECEIRHRFFCSSSVCFEKVENAVRKGCILSLILFLLVLGGVRQAAISRVCGGLQWSMIFCLKQMDRIDNICLLSHRLMNLDQTTLDLEKEASIVNLTSYHTLPICVNGQNIEGAS